MDSRRRDNITEKVEGLASSLSATSDVLSTAERMMDHYKDLNRDQEREIAHLQEELQRSDERILISRRSDDRIPDDRILDSRRSDERMPVSKRSDERIHASRRSKHRALPRTPSSSDAEDKRPRSSRVRFSDDQDSMSEADEFETALRDLNRKQERLRRDLKRDQQQRSEELQNLGDSLRQRPEARVEETMLDRRLKEIQLQIEQDKSNRDRQQDDIGKLSHELRNIRSLVQDSVDSKYQQPPQQPLQQPPQQPPQQPSSYFQRPDVSMASQSFTEELHLQREKARRDQETMSDLQRQLRKKEENEDKLLSQLKRTKSVADEGEIQQQKFVRKLEDLQNKYERENEEKRKLISEMQSFRDQASKTERERNELLSKTERERNELLSELNHFKTQPRIGIQSNELQRKVDTSERQIDQLMERLNTIESENDRKDLIIAKLKSQSHELSSRIDKSDSDKRKYMTELEEAFRKLRDTTRELDATKATVKIAEGQIKDAEGQLKYAEGQIKENEEKRTDLKTRALEAIKEYRNKCRELEKDRDRYLDKKDSLEREVIQLRTENKELESSRLKFEEGMKESRETIDKLESDLQRQHSQLSQVYYEKSQLEEALTMSTDVKKEISRLQRELQDLNAQKLALSSKLAEESAKRRDVEDQFSESKEKQLSTKEEASALYQQLQEERTAHGKAMKKMEDELQSISDNEERTLRDILDKANHEKGRAEDEIKSLKNQLNQERAISKDSQLKQENHEVEIGKLNDELNRSIEENRRLRKRYQLCRRDYEDKIQRTENTSDRERERISELEDELRNNQETLLRTRESIQISLRDICAQVDNLLDNLIQEAEESIPVKGLSDSIPVDTKKWTSEINDKLRNCCSLFFSLREKYGHQRNHVKKAQDMMEDVLKSSDQDKSYFIMELKKQNGLLNNLEQENKALENKQREGAVIIKGLQNRIAELTSHLEKSTHVLHASIDALEERRKVLDELDELQDEQRERDRISENYIKYKERIGSLQEQLEEAKSSLEGVKQDNVDTSTFTAKLLQSFGPLNYSPKKSNRKNTSILKSSRLIREPPERDIFRSSQPISTSSDIEDDDSPSPRKKSKDIKSSISFDKEFSDRFLAKKSFTQPSKSRNK